MKPHCNAIILFFFVIFNAAAISVEATNTPSDSDLAFPATAAAAALADEDFIVPDSQPDTQPPLPLRVPRMRARPPAKSPFMFDFIAPQLTAPANADTSVYDTARFSYYSRVYALPTATAPMIGIVTDTGIYLVRGTQGEWYQILFGSQEGWVRQVDAFVYTVARKASNQIVSEPTLTSMTMQALYRVHQTALQAREVIFVLISQNPVPASGIAVAALLILVFGLLLRRKKTPSVKRQVSTIALASKKILMAGGHEKNVRRALSDEAIPIETALTEAGFAISVFEQLEQLGEALGILIPSLIAVDCRGNANTINRTERLLMRRVTLVNVPVLFYNVPSPDTTPRSAILPNIAYLGALPTDWDVLKAINTLHSASGSPRAIRKSIGSSVLEGSIKGERLTELFHFIETGAKTGHLMVEHENKPFGIICFDKGRIVKAQTRDNVKMDAALAVLGLIAGSFRYITDRITEQPDCDLTITGIMLEWTKKTDETRHMMAVKEERREMERREKERKTAGLKGRDRRGKKE